MRIALGQINSTVGDLRRNADKIIAFSQRAADRGAEAVVFPELALNGYPPRDLVEKPSFVERTGVELERIASETATLSTSVIVGYVGEACASSGKRVTNSAAVIERGKAVFRQDKLLLPTYDVFDEARYFQPAESETLACVHGCQTALTICEDAWNDKQFWERRLYPRDPVEELALAGAKCLISINASPYHMHKRDVRRKMF